MTASTFRSGRVLKDVDVSYDAPSKTPAILRPLTSLEAIACKYMSAPEGRLYTYHVLAGARRLQAQQRHGDVSVRTYRTPGGDAS